MGKPQTSLASNLKKAELQGRLWPCPVSGGPFCPKEEAWWLGDLPIDVVCSECGYSTELVWR